MMRAKMKVTKIEKVENMEVLHFTAVAKKESYPEDGSDEDNTYAKFSPNGEIKLSVANPNLIGKFAPGETFYIDFTKAE